jgi:hemoglobin-like flavoprotein
MNASTVSIVKATAPLVSQHARQITGLFYKNMFANNPETLQFFNQANQVWSDRHVHVNIIVSNITVALPCNSICLLPSLLIHILFGLS